MTLFQKSNMIYRNFGNSGLQISAISFGNMINYKKETYEEDKKIVEVALKNGINFFDTAELYAMGEAEIQLGNILKELKVPRQDIVVATKIRTAVDPQINSNTTLNRKHVRESIDKSLKRLQLDYVDILFAHFYDENTPLQEICRSFHEVIEDGKCFYWATSNWDAQSIFNALAICEKLNLHKPIGAQNQYNMLVRSELESEYISLFEKYNYGLIAWSPLAGGFLTGKYLDGINQNELTRFTDTKSTFPVELIKGLFYTPHATEKTIGKLKQLDKLAEQELGCKLTHLALAWVIKYQYTNTALIGARNTAQLQDCLKSLEVLTKLTPELEGRINKIIDTAPPAPFNFRTWGNGTPARPLAI